VTDVWTTPRTFVAGEVETAAIFNAHLRANLNAINGFVRKTADESVTSSAVLQNDDHLLYTISAAGTYVLDLFLLATSVANAAGDINVAFTFPTGTFYLLTDGLQDTLASGNTGTVIKAGGAITSGTAFAGFGLSTNTTAIKLNGLFIATATGTAQFQWAQQTSNANASKVLTGSYMTVRQVA
jgi:hypothetical protein